jgi:D-tyrosyl-tRNA(Tyr) deacylase
MKLVFLFCSDPANDPVASATFQQVKHLYHATETSLSVGGKKVFETKINDNLFFFVETRHVASGLYPEISHDINTHFSDADMIGLVNWHAGTNAPAKIFCAHSTADVTSGIFGATSGNVLSAVLLAIESEKIASSLTDFRTVFEASHWSGPMYERPVEELVHVLPPVFDIEIGSFPEDLEDPKAQEVVVKAIGKIPEFYHQDRTRVLYLGGIHFEPSATEMIFHDISIEHHLPNQWLVSGGYNLPGAETKIVAAAKSCLLKPQLIVYHAGLKSAYKEIARNAADILGIPCVSHKQLRAPDWKETILK